MRRLQNRQSWQRQQEQIRRSQQGQRAQIQQSRQNQREELTQSLFEEIESALENNERSFYFVRVPNSCIVQDMLTDRLCDYTVTIIRQSCDHSCDNDCSYDETRAPGHYGILLAVHAYHCGHIHSTSECTYGDWMQIERYQ